jgi:3'(2'), 5'-bisphosphate nucleotidase
VGEEDARDLRDASSSEAEIMRERINALANEALCAPVVPWENPEWGVGVHRTIDELLDAIDRGNHVGGRTGRGCSFIP